MYEKYIEMSLAFKCSTMVNKLNFLIPENFIDDMHIFIKAKVFVDFCLFCAFLLNPKGSLFFASKLIMFVYMSDVHRMNEMETTQTSLTSSNSLNDIKESEIIEVSKEKITHQNEKKIAMVFEKDEKQRIDEATKVSPQIPRVTLEIVVLDQITVKITHEILRHLIETYQLYFTQKNQRESGDLHYSHFQYILVNKTETNIIYVQYDTQEFKVLRSNETASFAFINPYQKNFYVLLTLFILLFYHSHSHFQFRSFFYSFSYSITQFSSPSFFLFHAYTLISADFSHLLFSEFRHFLILLSLRHIYFVLRF